MRSLLLIVLFAISTLVQSAPHFDNSKMPPTKSKHFLEQCSDIGIVDATSYSFAYGHCLSYTRGVVVGYSLTKVSAKLWCVPPGTTSEALTRTILAWVELNTDRFNALMSKFPGTNAATAVIIAALSEGFPCSLQ
jgi:hypothetical protein